ncbi:hypothetical protein CLV58_11395 [Spirosoma oryzae]|uniref:Uncharacterized protein n=1 Tax=Spirosoma oryzae TaxID=1469603 RepID=A0A2T0SRD7_9BACT|nr:hypothetical protein [Spirosoma oryzae]PRY35967.1 hypothetical protein CLV58_11395 [Spirosoma oryzae]
MTKLYFIVIALLSILVGCNKPGVDANSTTPRSGSEYFVSFKMGQKTYLLDKSASISNLKASGVPGAFSYFPGKVSIRGIGDTPLDIALGTNQASTGKPESRPVVSGYFNQDQFTSYFVNYTPNEDMGTLNITSIDNNVAEGTFTMVVTIKGTLNKVPITDGKFRVKFM